jgi:hypothetical protein
MESNGIGDEGAVILSQCLTSLPLRILHLEGNSIGLEGIRSLAAALPQCRGLEELNLCRNKLGENSAPILQQLVSSIPRLTLRVSSNVQRYLVLPTQTRDSESILPADGKLKALFLTQLKPDGLSANVSFNEPNSLAEAMKMAVTEAMSLADMFRKTQAQRTLMQ